MSSVWHVLGLQGTSLIAVFFLWGLGSGAQTLARPLYAFSFTESVFLVTLLVSALALSRMVSSPITGYLTDRIGRKPLSLLGAFIRCAASVGNFYSTSYVEFFILEFIGAVGVSMWQTTASILIADMTDRGNRGRAVGLRNTATRLGMILGPLVGGLIAAAFGLRAMFLLNAATKAIVFFITLFLIKETRPEAARSRGTAAAPAGGRAASAGGELGLSFFLSKPFMVLAMSTIGIAIMGQGIFQNLFPLHSQEQAGLNAMQIGVLISTAGILTLVFSFPNGMVVDRFGRKTSLVPGMLLLGGAAVLMGMSTDYGGALRVALAFGVAQAMTMGASQAFAMDLAPEGRRGSFMGIWQSVNSFGAFIGPLLAGALVEQFGFGVAFYAVAAWMGASALLLAVLGPETGGRRGET